MFFFLPQESSVVRDNWWKLALQQMTRNAKCNGEDAFVETIAALNAATNKLVRPQCLLALIWKAEVPREDRRFLRFINSITWEAPSTFECRLLWDSPNAIVAPPPRVRMFFTSIVLVDHSCRPRKTMLDEFLTISCLNADNVISCYITKEKWIRFLWAKRFCEAKYKDTSWNIAPSDWF